MTLADFPPPQESVTCEPDWVAGIGQSAKSDEDETAAFTARWNDLAALDPSGTNWDVVTFAHWDLGWTQHIFTRPGFATL